MKKYELIKTETKVNFMGVTLFRIRRLCTKEKGGWVESENNLSQCGNAWVYGDAG